MLALAPARFDSSHRRSTPSHAGVAHLPLRETVEQQLRQTDLGDLRHVQISESNGRVHLRGTVQSFYAKQTAQVVAASVPGVTLIRNELVVK
jgi:osmotically-inducible protein OsmY